MSTQGCCHDGCLRVGRQPREPQKNYPTHEAFLAKYQFTKILIRGDKHRIALIGRMQYLFIADPCDGLGYIENIVAICTQSLDDRAIHAFVCGELHAALSEMG